MTASIIIPSYNGQEKFPHLLDALSKQTFKDFETILVLDGSKDNSEAVAKANPWNLPNLTVLPQQNKGRSGARNTGVKHAKADILMFVDDDIIPPVDFVEKHVDAQNTNDIVVGMLGPDNTFNADEEFVSFSSYMNDKWNTGSFLDETGRKEITYITACNLSIKRSVFEKIGGFDERLRDAEDFDLALRLKDKNYTIILDQDIIAKHMIFGSFMQYCKRMREYGKARKKLMEINPLAVEFFKKDDQQFSLPKKMFFYFFALKFWPFLADKKMLSFIPEKFRFKMYDFMLTGNTLLGNSRI